MTQLEELSFNLRESDCPFFSTEELQGLLDRYGDVKAASYEGLILKSQNTTLSVAGLNCADTSKYFLRLATRYRKNNTGIMKGAF